MKRETSWCGTVKPALHFAPGAVLLALGLFAASRLRAAPAIVHQPLDLAVGPSDRAGFVVDATIAAPAAFQWYHDGTAMAGATSDLLIIEKASAADAGKYQLKISDATGETWSNAATLTVAPYTASYVDSSFRLANLDQSTVTASTLLSDGRLVLAESYAPNSLRPLLLRINSDGSRDVSFKVAPSSQSISVIVPSPDGSLYIGSGDAPQASLIAKLKPTGEIDATFQPPSGTGAAVVVPQADKVVVNQGATLVRLNQDGSLDPSFVFATPPAVSGQPIVAGCTLTQGKIYVATATVVWRITADGTIDASFAAFTLPGSYATLAVTPNPPGAAPSQIVQLAAVPTGGVMVRTEASTGGDWPPYSTSTIQRLTDTGAVDSSFTKLTFGDANPQVAVLPDGKLLLAGAGVARSYTSSRSWNTGVIQVNVDGSIDPTFVPVDLPRSDTSATAWATASSIFVLPGGTQAIVGGTTLDSWRRINLQSVGAPSPPRILRVTPGSATLAAGDDLTLSVQAVGPGPITLGGTSWQATPGSSTITFKNPYPNDSSVTVYAYGLGGTDQREIPLLFTPAAPHFSVPSETIVTSVGRDVRLPAERRGSPNVSLEWDRGSDVLVPADSYPLSYYDYLDLKSVSPADAGDYRVIARNALGQAEKTIHLVVLPASSLINVSCRARMETGDRTAILGFTLVGTETQQVLVRAVGMELGPYVTNALTQPGLRFLRGENEITPAAGGVDVDASVGALPLYWHFRTSIEGTAIVTPDTYTLMVSPLNGVPGIGLAEFFQLDRNSTQLAAFSARTFVGTGQEVTQTGFVVTGADPLRLLVRAVGPGLQNFGVSGALEDPVLQVVNLVSHTVVADNDDWQSGDGAPAVSDATTAVQAFPLASGSKDAALIVSVPPGMYTAVVSGKNGATGIALTQVYVLR